MKKRTTTSDDGRITLRHNAEWIGTVEIVITGRGREGTCYGSGGREGTCYGSGGIPVDLLLSGDFDRSTYLCGEIGERDMRRATAMAVASAARSAVDLLSSITIKDVDHG